MKKVLFNDGVKVELAYHTFEVSFGDKKTFTNRLLTYSINEKNGVRTEYFDLDDYRTIYGEIDGDSQWLSVFEILGCELAEKVESTEFEEILEAIRSFEFQLMEFGSNGEFASELQDKYEFNGGYED